MLFSLAGGWIMTDDLNSSPAMPGGSKLKQLLPLNQFVVHLFSYVMIYTPPERIWTSLALEQEQKPTHQALLCFNLSRRPPPYPVNFHRVGKQWAAVSGFAREIITLDNLKADMQAQLSKLNANLVALQISEAPSPDPYSARTKPFPKVEYIGSGTETTASLTKLLSSKTSNSPGCAKCDNAVVFQLIRAVSAETGFRTQYAAQICLYELPVLDDKEEIAG
jgi:hypothetical protein